MKQSIGNFLLRRLQEAGIQHIFGVPGDYNLGLAHVDWHAGSTGRWRRPGSRFQWRNCTPSLFSDMRSIDLGIECDQHLQGDIDAAGADGRGGGDADEQPNCVDCAGDGDGGDDDGDV